MSIIQELGIQTSTDASFSETQSQTRDAFHFKWSRRSSYESPAMKENARKWLFERYCQNEPEKLATWLQEKPQIILDAGCGSGFSGLLFFGDHLHQHHYLGIDISQAQDVARERFEEFGYPGEFLQADVFNLNIPPESIDFIFSEGVLHHTDNTQKSFSSLAKMLKPGGRLLCYVYAKKAVIREYTDDLIREHLKGFSDEEAWEKLKPLSELGKSLGELNTEITVNADIDFLGIKKGEYNLQRFFYWFICKAFYNPEYSLEEMNHINFDWFRPLNCHRHTPEEIKQWCELEGLEIESLDVQEAGISLVATKP